MWQQSYVKERVLFKLIILPCLIYIFFFNSLALASTLRSSASPVKARAVVTVQSVEKLRHYNLVKEDGEIIRLGCGAIPKDLSGVPSQQAAHAVLTSTYLDWTKFTDDVDTFVKLKSFGYLKMQPKPFTASEFYCDVFNGKGISDDKAWFSLKLEELVGKKIVLEVQFTVVVHYIDGVRLETLTTNKIEIRNLKNNKLLAYYNGKDSVSPYGANLTSTQIINSR